MQSLSPQGLVVRTERDSRYERPAILNPDFFAYGALAKILDGLLQLDPEIMERARIMQENRLRSIRR